MALGARIAIAKLNGLVSLVTGGASGLGRGAAELLVKQGGRVVVCDINAELGEEVAKNLGDSAVFVQTDVTSEDQVKKAIDTARSKFGQLDVAVNCAGITVAIQAYNQKKDALHPIDTFDKVQKVNTLGTYNVCRLAAQAMCQNQPDSNTQRGVIINTASIAAYEGQRGQTAYAASKGAIVSLTLPLAREYANYGIRVMTIAPGLFLTPIVDHIPKKLQEALPKLVVFPQAVGTPEIFAHLVGAIVENPYLNGEVIRLDGALRLPPN